MPQNNYMKTDNLLFIIIINHGYHYGHANSTRGLLPFCPVVELFQQSADEQKFLESHL